MRKFIGGHSFLLPSPPGKVSPPQAVTDEGLQYNRQDILDFTAYPIGDIIN